MHMNRALVCVGKFGVCPDHSRPGGEEAAFDIQIIYVLGVAVSLAVWELYIP